MKAFALMLLGLPALVAEPALMPMPASYAGSPGRLAIGDSFRVAVEGFREPRLDRAAERFLGNLRRITGIAALPSPTAPAGPATLTIAAAGASEPVQRLGEDESYRLEIAAQGARLTAPNPLGILRGMETFLQLVNNDAQGWNTPLTVIEDRPRFPWRGLSFDTARHFMPVEVLKRNLDGMAAVKLNVLHWHIVDDQGWRVESKKYPKLQQLGSDGLFYTQDQVREVIEYARDRGIRVVPEFDIPGHSTALLAAYPELGVMPGPYQIERKWGIFDPTLDPTKEEVYTFLDGLIGEMAGLFPDAFFHIGGDEVSGKHWRESEHIQAFMKEKGYKDIAEFHRYFNSRVQPIVAKHGKRMEGWDEILAPGLPKDIVIQSWRGTKSLVSAAQQGYAGLLSNGYYLDLMEPASRHYLVDPLPPEAKDALTPEQQKSILGGEGAMWTEYASPETVDSRIWPRLAAIAERFWSNENLRDVDSMYVRMEQISKRLEFLGLTHRSAQRLMAERIADGLPVEPILTLLEAVEPVKGYQRGNTASYTQQTPLNRPVDAAYPESMPARAFNRAVKDKEWARVRADLQRWQANDARLQPIARQRELLRESAVLSADLARVAAIGLKALDAREKNGPIDAAFRKQSEAALKDAAKQKGALMLMILPGVYELIGSTPPPPARQ